MRKRRICFGALTLTIWLLFFTTDAMFLLPMGILLLLLPIVFHFLLLIDRHNIWVECNIPSVCAREKEVSIDIVIHTDRIYGAGVLKLQLVGRNILLDETHEWNIMRSIQGKRREEHHITFVPTLCGETEFTVKQLQCMDIFGICCRQIRPPRKQYCKIYPKMLRTTIAAELEQNQSAVADKLFQNKRGNDLSEVFDLRDYVPGDDIKTIHWKMSAKLGHAIVKEASAPTKENVLVLLDFALEFGEKSIDKKLVSTAFEMAATIGARLTYQGIMHDIAMYINGELVVTPITSRMDYIKMVEKHLSFEVPKKTGSALDLFAISAYHAAYSKILYVCAYDFPANLETLLAQQSTTAVCVSDDEQIKAVKNGMIELIKIPIASAQEDEYCITI